MVLGHMVERAINYYMVNRSLFLIIYSFHMPAFLFISGLFAKRTVRADHYDWKKLVPYLFVWLVLGLFRDWSLHIRKPEHGYSIYNQNKISWFMLALFVSYTLAWLLRNVSWKIVLPSSIVVGLAVGYLPFISEGFALSRIIVYFPFFYTGVILDRNKFAAVLDKTASRISGAVIMLVWIILCFAMEPRLYLLRRLFTGQNSYSEIPNALGPVEFLFRLLTYVISAVLIFSFLTLVPRGVIPGFTVFGARTLSVYFWHLPILDILTHMDWAVALLKMNVGVQLVFTFTFSLALTYLFSLKPFTVPVNWLMNPWSLFEKFKKSPAETKE